MALGPEIGEQQVLASTSETLVDTSDEFCFSILSNKDRNILRVVLTKNAHVGDDQVLTAEVPTHFVTDATSLARYVGCHFPENTGVVFDYGKLGADAAVKFITIKPLLDHTLGSTITNTSGYLQMAVSTGSQDFLQEALGHLNEYLYLVGIVDAIINPGQCSEVPIDWLIESMNGICRKVNSKTTSSLELSCNVDTMQRAIDPLLALHIIELAKNSRYASAKKIVFGVYDAVGSKHIVFTDDGTGIPLYFRKQFFLKDRSSKSGRSRGQGVHLLLEYLNGVNGAISIVSYPENAQEGFEFTNSAEGDKPYRVKKFPNNGNDHGVTVEMVIPNDNK